jgi:hypothetical protein
MPEIFIKLKSQLETHLINKKNKNIYLNILKYTLNNNYNIYIKKNSFYSFQFKFKNFIINLVIIRIIYCIIKY